MASDDRNHEHVLVLLWQAGNLDAFTEIYQRYQGPLKYYLRRLATSNESADDLLQSVWLKALKGIGALRRPEVFHVWIYRIARNEVFALSRRDRRRRETELSQRESVSTNEDSDSDSLFTADSAARLHAALQALSARHRDVLMLRYMENFSYEQIATVAQCDIGTVRSRLHYAKIAIRRIWEEQDNVT